MENLELWNKVKQPPTSALKKITGGRLNGKSDINPQWRYEAMTENFGICGIGWKFTVDKKWLEPVSDNQVVAFADITLYIKVGDVWSDGIPANGGSMLVEKEKAGLHSSDEAFKMSITDALGTAMKMLGVAADIYAGKWDGSKYKDAPEAKKEEKPVKADDIPESLGNEPQENIVFAILKDINIKTGINKTGKNAGKSWKLFNVVTETGDTYGTFDETIADKASSFIKSGETAKIEFSVTQKGNKQIESIEP